MSENVTKNDGFLTAAALYAAGRPVAEIASAVGVCSRTVLRWSKRPAFRAMVDKLRSDLLTAAVGKLLDTAGDAVEALKRNLSCGNASAEIAAARSILSTAMRGIEQSDLLKRFEELQGLVTEIVGNESRKPSGQSNRSASPDSGSSAEGEPGEAAGGSIDAGVS